MSDGGDVKAVGPFGLAARRAAELIGDVAVATQAVGDELVTVAAEHRSPERAQVARGALGIRFRRGEGLPGRVWESGQGILLVEVDNAALAEAVRPRRTPYVSGVGLSSLMIVPLRDAGAVVGTLGVARDKGGSAYGEQDYDLLCAIAGSDVRLRGG